MSETPTRPIGWLAAVLALSMFVGGVAFDRFVVPLVYQRGFGASIYSSDGVRCEGGMGESSRGPLPSMVWTTDGSYSLACDESVNLGDSAMLRCICEGR